LSPTFFNQSIDHIASKLSEEEVSSIYGYNLVDQLENLSVLLFADDTALIANSTYGAVQMMAMEMFKEIGLEINLSKCEAIRINNGDLVEEDLEIEPGLYIRSVKKNEQIKYLGIKFNDEIVFDSNETFIKFRNQLERLVATPMLHSDQKLIIFNQCLWPTLVYQLQYAPLESPSVKKFLEDCDKIIRSAVKDVLMVPEDIPNAMMYAPRKYKGLGLIKAAWEGQLQQLNITTKLKQCNNAHLNQTMNFEELQRKFCRNLKLTNEEIVGNEILTKNHPAKIARGILREKEFSTWTKLPQKGQGVSHFREVPYANSWIFNTQGLANSEWKSSIKMLGGVAAVRMVPGKSQSGILCRFNCGEKESLGHVLGGCKHNEQLIDLRHNNIRAMIAEELRSKGSISQ